MTTTPHPYAHILNAIAEGKNVQWQESSGEWANQSPTATLLEISNQEFSPARYRVHAKTIRINGREVPEPLRVMPPNGTKVYWPNFDPSDTENLAYGCVVGFYEKTLPTMLQRGLLHLTAEAASAHAAALISLTHNA